MWSQEWHKSSERKKEKEKMKCCFECFQDTKEADGANRIRAPDQSNRTSHRDTIRQMEPVQRAHGDNFLSAPSKRTYMPASICSPASVIEGHVTPEHPAAV